MARYTLIQSGDFNAAENIGALAGDIQREGIVSGLGLSGFDPSIPEIDVAAGKTVHVIDSQTAEATIDDGTTVSEQRVGCWVAGGRCDNVRGVINSRLRRQI